MTVQGGLFDDALPFDHTETQAAWAARMERDYGGLGTAIWQILAQAAGAGLTPWEVVYRLGLEEKHVIAVRSNLTTMHQAGDIVRTRLKRKGQHVYVVPWAWRPAMGFAPSKAHHGRGSL